ncbi:GNAT family N-acetyltransferase [Jeongeupia naejangsanensis]|uniref:GNAT family N-acetyltransferase n=1 Tax=Jeongeupia naejangsanensis TaxID=613195 RepID=A0ABS2BQW3_9NEIS|nr:GNAT family protein [Jeongeupia naejangsanensis]MBM3117366.1 GNAT family N-acetyltransferase [Jeongeupia naejangsanensis]
MNVSLREPVAADASFWAGLRAEASARAVMPFAALTGSQLAERLATAAGPVALNDEGELLRIIRVDGDVVGLVGAHRRSSMMQSTELSVHVAEPWRGRGIAAAALHVWTGQLFDAGYRRLWATVSAGNAASCALWSRLGFTQEGVLREHYLIDGRAVDQLIYGLLRSERKTPPQPAVVRKEN